MKKRLIEFRCPSCGSCFSMVRDTYLIFREQDVETQRLLEQGYFVHVCRKCGHPFYLEYPLMMRFSAMQTTLVFAAPDQQAKQFEDIAGRVVLCRSHGQFEQAFSILRLQLPFEKTIPILKKAAQREGGVWLAERYDPAQQVLWLQSAKRRLAVRFEENPQEKQVQAETGGCSCADMKNNRKD